MTRGITTSIRLEHGLSQKLDRVAHDLHRGKNWLISEALRKYLEQLETPSLVEEARSQSLLASTNSQENPDIDDLWERNSDQDGWSV